MPDLSVVSRAACLPLFLFAAWLTSYRSLSEHLRYKLPLSLQWRLPAVRRFWVCDLLVSVVAFVFVFFVARVGLLGGYLGQELLANNHVSWSLWVDPLLAAVLGCTWPRASALGIVTEKGRTFGLGQIRDVLLGGQAVNTVNNHVRHTVEDYLRRVATQHDISLPELHSVTGQPVVSRSRADALQQLASENFERLYLHVSRQMMIPLVDRPRCLMSVPGMTANEAERLYQSGVTRWQLMFGKPIDTFEDSRWNLLRQNARGMVRQRLSASLAVAVLAITLLGAGLLAGSAMSPGLPVPQAGGASPAADSEAEARAEASAIYVSRDRSSSSRELPR